jgi:hypothetical protein
MSKTKHKEYIAFKCMECNIINVFPKARADGNRCIECGGVIGPIGNARVHEECKAYMNIGINVDTTELDKALDKAEILYKTFCNINDIAPL